MTIGRSATSAAMSTAMSTKVTVVPGEGILARRPNVLFFSPVAPDDGPVSALLEVFEATLDDASVAAAVTDAVVAAAFEAVPFTVIGWTGALEVVVLGGVEVLTDHPALPMLSGAGSGSWVERRLGTLDGAVTVRVGGPADVQTDLVLGRVRAGGFAAIVTVAARRQATDEREVHPTPAETDAAETDTAATPAETDTAATPPAIGAVIDVPVAAARDDPGLRLEGLAALKAATGGDWMEESLGLGPRGPQPTESPAPAAPPQPSAGNRAFIGDVDDEVTLGGDDVPSPAAIVGPPAWPGDDATPDRVAGDIPDAAPGDIADSIPGVRAPSERRLVPSRKCPDGHPNPPLAETCRVCGVAIEAAAPTVTVAQPVLGNLVLGDGGSSAIDRALVLGRRPDAAVAGMPAGSHLIAVSSEASVSRTHAVVRADGWTVTVTDCGSRSGTAVLMPGGDEPVLLQPWIPHEVVVGTQIFLGGPTAVSIEPAGGADQ